MSLQSLALTVAVLALALACSGGDLLLPGGDGPAPKVEKFDGDDQTTPVGTRVPVAPAVVVTDDSGSGMAGIDVTFEVVEGGGRVAGAETTTDDNGIAAVERWTLGDEPGVNRLQATVQRSGITGNPITFSATATEAPAAPPEEEPPIEEPPARPRLVFQVQPSDTKEGAEIEPAIVVSIVDAKGNVVPDIHGEVELTLLGGRRARLRGDTDQALRDGIATFRGLHIDRDARGYRIRASLNGLTSVESSTFDIIDD